ncbi:MAG: hypothetical protein KBG15_10920 [Kofleriaceae bacterium]|nr:hypothetical protein [Kofleriaceae bacterium]
MIRLILLSSFISAVALGCGSDAKSAVDAAPVDAAQVDAAPTRTIAETRTVASQDSLEGTFTAKKTDRIVITLTSTGPIDWNIHGHADGATQIVKGERDVTTVNYSFTPLADGDWFIIMANKGATSVDVQVRFEVYGSATLVWN